MIYARAHDQNVAEDYFTAMHRVEERLEILSPKIEEPKDEDVKVQIFQLIQQLETPKLELEERLGITSQLREVLRVSCEDDACLQKNKLKAF